MFLLKSKVHAGCARHNLTFSVLKQIHRNISITSIFNNKTYVETSNKDDDALEAVIDKFESKILYNSTIEKKRLKFGFKKNNAIMLKNERYNEKLKTTLASIQPLPISLKYFSEDIEIKSTEESNETETNKSEEVTQFPYNDSTPIEAVESTIVENTNYHKSESIDHEIRRRHELIKGVENWMSAYDNYENDLTGGVGNDWKINYGTPDATSKISNVPCGGCGALLHCKDSAIPGYIPSEIYKNYKKKGAATLQAIICQRCYFLKEHDLALQVRVSPDDYSKVLTTISGKRALVVLMVDLMDFPCSIWPGIADILGPNTPIVLVGNKVDLLPKDGDKFVSRVKQSLLHHCKLSGFAMSNIWHVSLISAKTGFGIEDLITSLQRLWKHKGDVYLVGCTNVGKSSLFNALLQSDYCKIQAADLIQRATTSRWPGTTLNLLKFPILRPSGHRLYMRQKRLELQDQITAEEKRLRSLQLATTKDSRYATLIGHIGQTFTNVPDDDDDNIKDFFSVRGYANASGKVKMGINEGHPDYVASRWCFDTPGVIQPDQILHLLTIEELVDTLPKALIRPETFCVKPGTSLFIAGLARLDYLDGPGSIRLTVFRSNELPVTVCPTAEAGSIYGGCIGTDLFKVPINKADRLLKWPGLEPKKPFTVTGIDWKSSCKDVVLSSAGWIAINCGPNKDYNFQAWTPEKRGIYIRDSLLPKAVMLRGARIRFSVAYKSHKFQTVP